MSNDLVERLRAHGPDSHGGCFLCHQPWPCAASLAADALVANGKMIEDLASTIEKQDALLEAKDAEIERLRDSDAGKGINAELLIENRTLRERLERGRRSLQRIFDRADDHCDGAPDAAEADKEACFYAGEARDALRAIEETK